MRGAEQTGGLPRSAREGPERGRAGRRRRLSEAGYPPPPVPRAVHPRAAVASASVFALLFWAKPQATRLREPGAETSVLGRATVTVTHCHGRQGRGRASPDQGQTHSSRDPRLRPAFHSGRPPHKLAVPLADQALPGQDVGHVFGLPGGVGAHGPIGASLRGPASALLCSPGRHGRPSDRSQGASASLAGVHGPLVQELGAGCEVDAGHSCATGRRLATHTPGHVLRPHHVREKPLLQDQLTTDCPWPRRGARGWGPSTPRPRRERGSHRPGGSWDLILLCFLSELP